MVDYSEILMSGQQFKKIYERKCNLFSDKYGLTKIEIEILLFLEKNKKLNTAKDIVELKFYTKSHVSKAIDHLVSSGYLIGQSSKHDRRCIHLKVSENAKQVIQEALEMRRGLLDILYKDVTMEERAILDQVAKKIVRNIKDELENRNNG